METLHRGLCVCPAFELYHGTSSAFLVGAADEHDCFYLSKLGKDGEEVLFSAYGRNLANK